MAETAGLACLGKIGGMAVEKIGGYFVNPIGRQYRSLFRFNSNIENLETQLEKLETTRRGVQMGVDEAKRNVRTIFPNVEAWLTSVDEVTTEAKRIIEDKAKVQQGCLKGWCPNLKLRYSVSNNAMKTTQDLERLQAEGSNFNYTQLSYGPTPPSMEPIPNRGFKGFESRRLCMEEIIKALKDEEIDLIGICGMGGVGKTTMAKEVAKRVREENMFDEVALTVVSQEPDLTKVQKCIADMFGLNLDDKENPMARASLLRKRLLQDNKKILVILDDIWAEIPLEDMGIPLGVASNSVKTLYTSRTRDLWYDVQRKKEIPLELLSKVEAWQLFREKAGDSVDVPDLQPIAKQIMNECGRLPLALVIIGGALSKTRRNNVTKSKWEAMLDRLTSCSSSTPADKRLFSSLELSYTCLEDEEAKRLFLLCCLFEEDRDIRIEDLARYGMGLSLFEGINGMEKVRRRVLSLVDDLKSRYLLLDSEYDDKYYVKVPDTVKVHDVVRDVGISIASRDKGALVSHGGMSEWPKKYEHCTSISVSSRKIKELPEGLRCPNLEFLLLRCEYLKKIPCNFFEGMGELKVLGLKSRAIPSLQFLRNLQTLTLDNIEEYLDDFTGIGELLNLEVLSFRNSWIKKLPEEIRRLTKLRLLDLRGCLNLKRIPSGVISCLARLEELYMGGMEEEVEFLGELESLPNLNTLEINITIRSDVNFPEVPIFSKLKKYTIVIKERGRVRLPVKFPMQGQKTFNVYMENLIPSDRKGINTVLTSAECVLLEGRGCNDLVRELLREGVEGLQQLKDLKISRCDTPECLVHTMNPVTQPDATVPPVFPNLEKLFLCGLPYLREIWHGPLPAGSFGKLTSLTISCCKGLGNVFQISMVGCFMQLKRLSIWNCDTMEQVIWKDQRDDGHVSFNRIEFPKLEYMELGKLPRLIGFCRGIDEIDFPQLKELHLQDLDQFKCNKSNMSSDSEDSHGVFCSLFPQKVSFPKLEY